jgi:WD40 repeat protein
MRRLPLLLSIAVVCAVGARAQAPQATRIVLEGTDGEYGRIEDLAISPDGRQVAYIAGRDGSEPDPPDYPDPRYIWLKTVKGGAAKRVPIADLRPAFARVTLSPDGKSLLFWSREDLMLRRVPVAGGPSAVVCKVPGLSGMSWGADDRIVFSQGLSSRLAAAVGGLRERLVIVNAAIMRVAAGGGSPETLVSFTPNEFAYDPEVLPESNAVLFTFFPAFGGATGRPAPQIVAQPLNGGDRKVLVNDGRSGHCVSRAGQIVYSLDDNLFAVQFDPKGLQTTGAGVAVAEDVREGFAISPGGTLGFVTQSDNRLQASFVSRNGTKRPLAFPRAFRAPRISPDGPQVAVVGERGIWIADLDNLASMRRLTSGRFDDAPVWTPDGRRITYMSPRADKTDAIQDIYWRRADGSDQPELLIKRARSPEFWSAATGHLVFLRWIGALSGFWIYSPRDVEARRQRYRRFRERPVS